MTAHIPDSAEAFTRRTLTVRRPVEHSAELIVFVDGRQTILLASAKANMLVFYSRPSEDGFHVDVIEQGHAPVTDIAGADQTLEPWQVDATHAGAPGPQYRRAYYVEGEDLDSANKIEVKFRVDGEAVMHLEAREPGMMAITRNHIGASFTIEVVGAKIRYPRDVMGPSLDTTPVLPWQVEGIGLK